ncbi:hypothetical protein QMZ92_35655 [Streptomyces sp. HNM0645]|uniref:CASTOR/POLLUX-related putative ion channel n=1 Tax=Streptomyces sp. HNM0645 TaxID=2782343 RepID=UPI0024B70899|nr:hypothetical protein [Streptomyces sp. HNM0645]MDI9889493.1 hypothetical protein [Streptomyces sp. HNM0645]
MRIFTSKKLTLRRLHYHVETFFVSHGFIVLSLALVIICITVTIIFSSLVAITFPSGDGFFYDWTNQSLIHIAELFRLSRPKLYDEKWQTRIIEIFIGMIQLLFLSSMIGVINYRVRSRILDYQKGRSQVMEGGHVLLLGWSEFGFRVISELLADKQPHSIVLLADKEINEKVEDRIRTRPSGFSSKKLICRVGDPSRRSDLDLVSPATARSIILMPLEGPRLLKTLLHLRQIEIEKRVVVRTRVAVWDMETAEMLQLASDELQIIRLNDRLSRITARALHLPGFPDFCREVLNFAENEIYAKRDPNVNGLQFGSITRRYKHSTPIGLLSAEGHIELPPAMGTEIRNGDKIIFISREGSRVYEDIDISSNLPRTRNIPIDRDASAEGLIDAGAHSSRILVIGWNQRAGPLLDRLDKSTSRDSMINVAFQGDGDWRNDSGESERPARSSHGAKVSRLDVDISQLDDLDALPMEGYTHVILLAEEGLEPNEADCLTLARLMKLSHIEEFRGAKIAEMYEVTQIDYPAIFGAVDIVDLNSLSAGLISQIGSHAYSYRVLGKLMDAKILYASPSSLLTDTPFPRGVIYFSSIIEQAQRSGWIAMGYFKSDEMGRPPSFGVHLNPDKDVRIAFQEDDRIILLASRY